MAKSSKIAKDVFKNHKDAEECFVTSDGQAFLSKNSANLHATTNASGKKLKIEKFSRSEGIQTKTSTSDNGATKDLNAKDAITAVGKIDSLEDLNAFETTETARGDDARKTVITAIGKRRAELTPKGGDKVDANRKNDDQ